MFLYYIDADGKRQEVRLAGKTALTFGRSSEADVCIPDNRVSRIHAEIRPWNNDYIIKDLKSRNGILINGERAEIAILNPGDTIRIAGMDFHVAKATGKGTETIVREVTQELDQGKKGYRTILREIVRSTESKPKP
jgi:pSer/pThr/pTyr-binding forkhead associated (FHA) protein